MAYVRSLGQSEPTEQSTKLSALKAGLFGLFVLVLFFAVPKK